MRSKRLIASALAVCAVLAALALPASAAVKLPVEVAAVALEPAGERLDRRMGGEHPPPLLVPDQVKTLHPLAGEEGTEVGRREVVELHRVGEA